MKFYQIITTILMLGSLMACSTAKHPDLIPVVNHGHKPALIQSRHIVKRGENLHQIAWRYGMDYRKLARLNHLRSPYLLKPKQILFLKSIRERKNNPRTPKESRTTSSKPKAVKFTKKPLKSKAKRLVGRSERFNGKTVAKWRWPATGTVIRQYSLRKGSNGIDLKGRKGDPVRAAANGIVVYSGSGLRGYGKLIILKHNGNYLTAYGHNSKLLVKEGQSVKAGRQIAEMGNTESRLTMLHFEIRKHGKPVNPLKYLPKG